MNPHFVAMFPEKFDNCLYWEDDDMEAIEDTWLGGMLQFVILL